MNEGLLRKASNLRSRIQSLKHCRQHVSIFGYESLEDLSYKNKKLVDELISQLIDKELVVLEKEFEDL